MKRCSKKECCKPLRYVTFKGTMTKWPIWIVLFVINKFGRNMLKERWHTLYTRI